MIEQVLSCLGFPSSVPATCAERAEPRGLPLRALLPELDGEVAVLDLGVESESLAAGAWLDGRQAEERTVADALASSAAAVLPYGVYRLTRTAIDSVDANATWPTATEIRVAPGGALRVAAPVAGRVIRAG